MTVPDRVFVAGSAAEQTTCQPISAKLDAAMDILADADMLDEKRVSLLVACERNPEGGFGGDPEALARKLVHLRAALRPPHHRQQHDETGDHE